MSDEMEPLEDFRQRARAFIHENLRRTNARESMGILRGHGTDEAELAGVNRDREIQRMLFEAKLAGVCFPKEYGGLGLTPDHQRVLNEEIGGYEYPSRIQAPSLSPCAAVLLDFGTEEQKREHIPKMLNGEEIWMQLLSEPSGGSDVAGALTTAIRDGDEWILNGSKVWTTGAWWSDWGLCLARTDWDVPKHRGLTVFIFPLHQPGIEVQRIEMLNGFKDFCQEFITDVRIPDSDRVGEVNDGWTVGTRWMFHERMLTNSPLVTNPVGSIHSGGGLSAHLRQIAIDAGKLDDPRTKELRGEAKAMSLANGELRKRIGQGIMTRKMSDQSSAIGRLFYSVAGMRANTIAHEIAGNAAAAWSDDDGLVAELGNDFLMRQTGAIGGGTLEMAKNVIAERVLGMPREMTRDKDVAFREVPRTRPAGS
jgi:alkylation response protein AidB-like acyl-CoA dehydrogenase